MIFPGKPYQARPGIKCKSLTAKALKCLTSEIKHPGPQRSKHLADKGGNQRRKICASPERQKGAELPINPGPVYKNAGGDANRKTYGFKVIAYNKDGEAIASPEASPAAPDIAKPKNLTGYVYTNTKSSQTGYVNLIWDKVKNAKGYKINIYNGKDYQSFDVGDTDHWTTQNKHIWPSADEVKAGRFQLHTDGKGGELALDPSPVYDNANGNYKGKKNYSFTLTAYDANGDSLPTAPFNPVFHEGRNSSERKNSGLLSTFRTDS